MGVSSVVKSSCHNVKSMFCVVLTGVMLVISTPAECSKMHAYSSRSSVKGSGEKFGVYIAVEDAATFSRSVMSFSRQSKLVVVAEGFPIRSKIDRMTSEAIVRETDVERCIDAIALAYDYEVLRDRNGKRLHSRVVALRKRYSDGRDIPSLTLEECRDSMNDVVKIVQAFSNRSTGNVALPSQVLLDVMRRLTSTQIAQLSNGGIPIESLSREQKESARGMAVHMYIDTVTPSIYAVSGVLNDWDNVSIVCDLDNKDARIGFAHVGESGRKQISFFGQGLVVVGADAVEGQMGDAMTASKLSADTDKFVGSVVYKIKDVISLCNAPADAVKQSDATFICDPCLADKEVAVVGEVQSFPAQVLSAVAAVYGLRFHQVQSFAGGDRSTPNVSKSPTAFPVKWRLSRPRMIRPKRLQDVSVCVRSVLPDPLLRAIHDGDRSRPRQLGVSEVTHEALRKLKAETKKEAKAMKMRDAKSLVTLKLTSLTPNARSYFAINVMGTFLTALPAQLSLPGPRYIEQFEKAYLTGGVYKEGGEARLSLYFGFPSVDTGQVVPGVGISSVRVPSDMHIAP